MYQRRANSLSRNPPPVKLVVYGVLLVFLFLTCLALLKDKIHSDIPPDLNNLRQLQLEKCNVTEYKRDLIRNLEPLITREPLDKWEGLGKEEKNIKYLPSMTGLSRKDRIIYIDLGAREYESSIGSWFVKQYPKQNKSFEIYAVEADKAFHRQYESREGVTLLPYAAWIKNETVVFGSKPIVVKDKVWRMRPFGRIEGQKAEEDRLSAVVRVQAFDFVDWLKRMVKESDFVVVKMDVEGTEITLVRELVRRGAICLIDEMFMECHFDRYVKCCSGERINRFNYSYAQCYNFFSELREMGVVVHQWCEENVYLLCKKLVKDGIAKSDGSDLFVVFISNEKKQIPLWHQKASHRADGITLWDYHVICVQKRKESNLPHLVWDLDSSLPFPSPLTTYVAETIRPSFQLFSEFQRVFRIVHAPRFLRSFASDRRHMKDSAGNWINPPPSYEVIVAEDGTAHNLNEYMEMSSADVVKSIGADTIDTVLTQKLGVLVGENQLDEFFSQIPDN